jgi:hypothetical protein
MLRNAVAWGTTLHMPSGIHRQAGDPVPKCSAPNCDRDARALGMCNPHYKRAKAGRDLAPPIGRESSKPFTVRVTRSQLSRIVELAPDLSTVQFARQAIAAHLSALESQRGSPAAKAATTRKRK